MQEFGSNNFGAPGQTGNRMGFSQGPRYQRGRQQAWGQRSSPQRNNPWGQSRGFGQSGYRPQPPSPQPMPRQQPMPQDYRPNSQEFTTQNRGQSQQLIGNPYQRPGMSSFDVAMPREYWDAREANFQRNLAMGAYNTGPNMGQRGWLTSGPQYMQGRMQAQPSMDYGRRGPDEGAWGQHRIAEVSPTFRTQEMPRALGPGFYGMDQNIWNYSR